MKVFQLFGRSGLIAAYLLVAGASAQTSYYVANCGDDSWSGLSEICLPPDGPKHTIQAGMDASQNGDTVIVADGTYLGTGNRDLDFSGKAITLESENGAETCEIRCQSAGRGFYFHSGEDAASVVDGFKIRQGSADRGGAILCESSSPTIKNCIFENNKAFLGAHYPNGEGGGGAVYCDGSSPIISGCTFSKNSAWDAGAVFNLNGSSPWIENCAFTNNSAEGYTYSSGGAFYNWIGGEPTYVDCTFSGNSADYLAGAVANDSESLLATFIGCTFEANMAKQGGAVLHINSASGVFVQCIFQGNQATKAYGGAVHTEAGGSHTFINCEFLGNKAYENGGALRKSAGELLVSNCAFSGNTAMYGGAVQITAYLTGQTTTAAIVNSSFAANSAVESGGAISQDKNSTVDLVNSVFRSNNAVLGPQIALGYPTSSPPATLTVRYSDIEGGQANVYIGPGSGSTLTWGDGNIDVDPLFVGSPSNGGDGWGDDPETSELDEGTNDNYGDLRLQTGSPCIDAGDNAAVPLDTLDLDENGDTAEPLPFDLDGLPRFVDDPASVDTGSGLPPIVDMGVYEYQVASIPCDGDANGDGAVDPLDSGYVLARLGCPVGTGDPECDAADANADGEVDPLDVGYVLARFGDCT